MLIDLTESESEVAEVKCVIIDIYPERKGVHSRSIVNCRVRMVYGYRTYRLLPLFVYFSGFKALLWIQIDSSLTR